MKIYLVGGAVRDELLALPVREKDWMVTGGTPEEMLAKGYRPVGGDFPVFLHPKTHEEYALARTEKKNGRGYGGFLFYASPEVTVEQDLRRRDLTVNAIARGSDGNLIDPFGGVEDINRRILRHVSSSFVEDPLRVLRVARFAAQFHGLGFTVSPDTMSLMKTIVSSGELEYLPAERIWKETLKALETGYPDVYFQVLYQSGALHVLFSELVGNYESVVSEGISPARKALQCVASEHADVQVRFACAFCVWRDVISGKQGNEKCDSMLQRLKVPKKFGEVLSLVMQVLPVLLNMKALHSELLLSLLDTMDAFRRKERCLLVLAASDHLLDASDEKRDQVKYLKLALECSSKVDVQLLMKRGFRGKALAEKIREVRIERIRVLPGEQKN